ncbi:hypothetical protein ACFV3O_03240 [Streptomyces albidoflavus]
MAEVFAVADSIAPRYRLLVLLAAFTTCGSGSLRLCGDGISTWRG